MTHAAPIAQKVLNAIYGRTSRAARRVRYNVLRPLAVRKLSASTWQEDKVLMGPNAASSPPWLYHDEQWTHVINRWANRAKLAKGAPLDTTDQPQPFTDDVVLAPHGEISIHAKANTRDEWVYLYVDPTNAPWENYSWKVRFRCDTLFKELQFGFRYNGFYNRYRYRFQDGRLAFDMVINGQFVANLSSVPFPLEPGREYDLEIRAVENIFQCWIDGQLVSEDYDEQNLFPRGSVALILWEDDGRTDIIAHVRSNSVSALRAP